MDDERLEGRVDGARGELVDLVVGVRGGRVWLDLLGSRSTRPITVVVQDGKTHCTFWLWSSRVPLCEYGDGVGSLLELLLAGH